MDMSLTTPGLLFPAISLLLLAYTNRFVVLANVIRQLSAITDGQCPELVKRQIHSLRQRLSLIKWMQTFGVLSFVLCTLSMLSIFLQAEFIGSLLFGLSLLLLVVSLMYSLYEVHISTQAINIELEKLAL
ncbi:MAG: hypothetical protein ACI8VC_002356 [Candidatus Endobugula sp.]|jgi:hypothetical protein